MEQLERTMATATKNTHTTTLAAMMMVSELDSVPAGGTVEEPVFSCDDEETSVVTVARYSS